MTSKQEFKIMLNTSEFSFMKRTFTSLSPAESWTEFTLIPFQNIAKCSLTALITMTLKFPFSFQLTLSCDSKVGRELIRLNYF